MLNGLVTSVRTLTVFPVPGKDSPSLASALPWFPLVGLIIGLLMYGAVESLDFMTGTPWPEGAAAIAVMTGIIVTKGIHLDGLADWTDAFVGGKFDKQKTLSIMKDSHCGAFAIIAIASVVLFKWVSISRLITCGNASWIICAAVISRTTQVELAVWLPYAREDGTAAPFVRNAKIIHRLIAVLCAVGLVAVLQGFKGIIGLVVGFILCRAFGYWCKIRIGGITGDTLGACSEIVETAIVCISAIFVNRFGIV